MHAHTIHIITQCNQIVNSKIIKCSFSEGKKLKVTKMLSYPEHITTCISTQQQECSPTHPKGIQKSLQNTSPRGVNAAVKSVIRLLVSSKVQNSSAIYLSIRGDADLEGVCCDLTMD